MPSTYSAPASMEASDQYPALDARSKTLLPSNDPPKRRTRGSKKCFFRCACRLTRGFLWMGVRLPLRSRCHMAKVSTDGWVYSPKLVEDEFCELRIISKRRSSQNANKAKFTASCRSASDRPDGPGFLG